MSAAAILSRHCGSATTGKLAAHFGAFQYNYVPASHTWVQCSKSQRLIHLTTASSIKCYHSTYSPLARTFYPHERSNTFTQINKHANRPRILLWPERAQMKIIGMRALSRSAVRSVPRGVKQRDQKQHEEMTEGGADMERDVTKEERKSRDTKLHIPVMAEEVMDALEPSDNQILLDMTFGAGGHTETILQQCDTCQVLALDRDPVAYDLATKMADKYGYDRLVPLLGCFSDLSTLLKENHVSPGSIDGVLIDAGSSSMQFDTPERGFALSKNGPLDMRMDGIRIASQPTAADVVNSLDTQTLTNILLTYGEEPKAKKIAQTIVQYRKNYRPIETTHELATVVSFAFTHREADKRQDSLGRHANVATKTFLALRIFVNNELNELNTGLKMVEAFVRPEGKLAVLSFHSMEDRIVKRFMQGRDVTEKAKTLRQKIAEGKDLDVDNEDDSEEQVNKWRMCKSVLTPSNTEIEMNPRSRSAKLRVAVKL